MRQVPSYLIIGDGRVARHFQHYFTLLQLCHCSWDRSQPIEELQQFLPQATHILVLISDQAIDAFCQSYLKKTKALCIHFSGSHVSSCAYGAHPLTTFHNAMYTLEEYLAIPFMIDHDAPDFNQLLPGLSNKYIKLEKSEKAKYHAFCVLSGNFSCLLWQKLFTYFEKELHIPPSFAHPYLQQQTKNLLSDAKNALTGPLIRGDEVTLKKNITALENDPFQEIYQSFVECYKKMNEEVKHEHA